MIGRVEPIGIWAEVCLEDHFENQLQCPLYHAVADAGDLKRSDFTVFFRYIHPTIRLRLLSACYEIFPNFLQKTEHP